MLVGYARVSTQDQKPALQLDALKDAGCEKVFNEKASGAQRGRPQLAAAVDYMREGDTLVVWKLDRLARSMKQLIETVEEREAQGIGFRSLTEAIDTTDAGKARGRTGGRPKKLTDTDLKAAKAMLADDDFTVDEVAARMGVSPATLYRYLPAPRSTITRKEPT